VNTWIADFPPACACAIARIRQMIEQTRILPAKIRSGFRLRLPCLCWFSEHGENGNVRYCGAARDAPLLVTAIVRHCQAAAPAVLRRRSLPPQPEPCSSSGHASASPTSALRRPGRAVRAVQADSCKQVSVPSASTVHSAVPPRFQPRAPSPKITGPCSVIATVSSSLMKPRTGCCNVVSTDTTMPASSGRFAS